MTFKLLKSYLLISNAFFLNLEWQKMWKIFRLHRCRTIECCLWYGQNDLLPGLSVQNNLVWHPSSIFLWNKMLERKVCPRKVTIASHLYPQFVGNQSQGKWFILRVLRDSKAGMLWLRWRKSQTNAIHPKHIYRDFRISRATQCFCPHCSSNRLRRREMNFVFERQRARDQF